MVTDDDRRRIASECWERAYREEFTGEAVAQTIGTFTSGTTRYDHDAWHRLAELVEPAPTRSDRGPTSDPTERGIGSIYDWCFERIEGADGAEDYLYCTIMSAIEEYRHPERVTARTARPVDRGALLDVLDEMDVTVRCAGPDVERGYVESWVERIREACGEAAS